MHHKGCNTSDLLACKTPPPPTGSDGARTMAPLPLATGGRAACPGGAVAPDPGPVAGTVCCCAGPGAAVDVLHAEGAPLCSLQRRGAAIKDSILYILLQDSLPFEHLHHVVCLSVGAGPQTRLGQVHLSDGAARSLRLNASSPLTKLKSIQTRKRSNRASIERSGRASLSNAVASTVQPLCCSG